MVLPLWRGGVDHREEGDPDRLGQERWGWGIVSGAPYLTPIVPGTPHSPGDTILNSEKLSMVSPELQPWPACLQD
jgi:hypothetical protein